MLKKYLELLKRLIESFTKTGDIASFADYIEAIKCTFIILFSTIGLLIFFIALIRIPFMLYKKLTYHLVEQLNKINKEIIDKQNGEEDIYKKFNEVTEKLRRIKIIYWAGFTALYVPFMIPTFLFLGDLFLRFIK